MIDKWSGCYDDGWHGDIVPEAFSHPAKFSHGLIHRIYIHAKEMGWVKPGDWVLDPFGGVALGGLDALAMGLNWVGVELEAKFVSLGEQNIELWQRQLKGWPNLGTARIVQGDSRHLVKIIEKADIVISSPTYSEGLGHGGKPTRGAGRREDRNLDAMQDGYSHTPGNLGNLPEGSFRDVLEKADIVISSPPYSDIDKGYGHRPNRWNKVKDNPHFKGRTHWEDDTDRPSEYGHTPGNLANMKEGSIDLVCSSPPYDEGLGHGMRKVRPIDVKKKLHMSGGILSYGESEGQLAGDSTFWQASKEILSQCYDLLKPNGMSIWVCKDYVKAKKRVPFSDRWQALCESVGFKLVCRHQAMLVKEHGTQTTIHGDEKITTERKSFFRRLAESKGSPRIDFEDILCLVK